MEIVVLGAGVCGLATAMMLARDGHDVTVLERDPEPVPQTAQEAWDGWTRGGVGQFRQAHYIQPGARIVLEQELPEVAAALTAAGALRFDPIGFMPPSIADRDPRPDDERFVALTARRPVFEQVVADAAEDEPNLDVRRGVAVSGLRVTDRDGMAHVTGVRTEGAEELRADLVVDAMGRRSQLPRMLDEAGIAPMHEESEDAAFVYYTQFFASADGTTPQPRAALLTPIGSFSLLTLPSDAGTWCVTAFFSPGDRPLKQMRHRDRFHAVVGACPQHAHWLDGEELTDVRAMGGGLDRCRRLAVDGRPHVTGLALVADAFACTNPSLGRGISLGLKHARRLRDVVRDHAEQPLELAEAWDAISEAELMPWYRETVMLDRGRQREVDALRAGRVPDPPATPAARLGGATLLAMPHDPDIFRGFIESVGCLATLGEVLARPGFAERVLEVAAGRERPPTPGPDRERLLALLA
jgi:2-polyprenyl-6-methoxyphenol hydroxylase-like FAD-dependent oxidoreductase